MTEPADKVKRPASQYYWGDWFKDFALQSCSLPARGLWHEMNCLMHQGEPYGHLTMPNGNPMGTQQLANLCKIPPTLCKKLIAELEQNGVFSRTAEGVVYSRRMVRDEAVRQARAEGGKAGAEHGIKGAEAGKKGGRPAHDKGGSETPLKTSKNPPPSSSSSTSSSPSGKKKKGAKAPLSADLPTWMQALVDLYHEVLPELPGVVVMNAERQQALRDFRDWVLTSKRNGAPRATNDDEVLAWAREYFGRARLNDFIMGRGPRSPEHPNWRASIEYLLSAKGMQKVIEQTEAGE